MLADDFPIDFEKIVEFPAEYNKATRTSGGDVLNAISKIHPGFLGGIRRPHRFPKPRALRRFPRETASGEALNFGVRER